MDLVFATNNVNKLNELKSMLACVELKGLSDINCIEDIPETGNTLEDNASLKSHYVYNKYGINCFSDDTGLEIETLNGAPGVYSARYAGSDKDADANMEKVLNELKGLGNRRAQFRTVISLVIDGEECKFEGVVKGKIEKHKVGIQGFGYDPIFTPEGYNITFAEMNIDEKNKISHRGQAVRKLVEFLKGKAAKGNF